MWHGAAIPDILVSNEVVSQRKIERLVDLAAAGAQVSVCVDNHDVLTTTAAIAEAHGTHLGVFVEVWTWLLLSKYHTGILYMLLGCLPQTSHCRLYAFIVLHSLLVLCTSLSTTTLPQVDAGQARCGVDSTEELVSLAQAAVDLPGVEFMGMQAYHGGLQHVRDPADRHAAVQRVADIARTGVDALAAVGLACPVRGGVHSVGR